MGHFRAEEGIINIGFINIQGAYSHDKKGIPLPVAIIPTYIHSRMHAQRSRFTVHGKEKKCICDLIPGEILKKYQIDPDARNDIESDLRMLGIQCSSAFPDLDGLAKELTDLF